MRKAIVPTFQFVFHSEPTYQQTFETEMPLLIEMEDGEQWEKPDYLIETFASDHAVPNLCYRITDKTTNHVVGFSGDTRYLTGFAQFYHGADLLVHEVSFADCPTTEQNNGVCRHSSAFDAVQVCQEAHIKRALFTHTNTTSQQAALSVGKNLLHIPVEWATPNNVYTF